LGPNDFANGLLTSENGKFKLSTNTQLLFILNTQNNKNIEILNTNSSQKFITEIKVTKGVVTITSTEMKDPLSNDPGIKEVLAKWGDESKGTVNTKLVMQNNGILTLYAGDSQGGEGMVLWSFEVPDGIR
jgi:hypothetical protein